MSRHNEMVSFLRKMYAETKSPAVLEAARMYRNLFPGSLMPASATRQTPVIDYKNFMNTVAHAPCGTNQPDVCPAQVNTIINGTCTRDTGEETARENWVVPDFAQFKKGQLNGALLHGRTAGTPTPANFGKYNNAVMDELSKNGKKNQQDRLFMGVPNCTMPMRCGYTITNPLDYQGTDVGYASGGGGAGGAAQ
jgi:hypothetical protein